MFSVYLKNKHILRSSYFFIILNDTIHLNQKRFQKSNPFPIVEKESLTL